MKKTILDGITVLDFGNAWAGPLFARTMGDMGARVIKVESLRHPDITRALAPRVPDRPTTINNSGYFGYMNRSKMSVSLNITRPEGRDLAGEAHRHSRHSGGEFRLRRHVPAGAWL